MKTIMTIRESDVYPEKADFDSESFRIRNAARAVVLNDTNQVALLRVNAHGYHKLPGGGVEANEDMIAALKRELLEETGCSADIVGEVGEIVEYRDQWEMKQISHCYLARQTGERRSPSFTQSEIDDGFEAIWVADIDTAIALLEDDQPIDYDGQFVQRRDTALLNAAKRLHA